MRKVIVIPVAIAYATVSLAAYTYDMTCTITNSTTQSNTLYLDSHPVGNPDEVKAYVDLNGINVATNVTPIFTWSTGAPATIKAMWNNESIKMLVGAQSYIYITNWGVPGGAPSCSETR